MRRFLLLLFAASLLVRASSVDLGGRWERRIGGQLYDLINVPSSYRPVGTATLARTFQLTALGPDSRAILRFEGVAHQARVQINGGEVGRLGPWTPYEFDVTSRVRAGANDVQVEVTDWQTSLGPSAAWEAYGGIIRDVRVDIRPAAFIENVHVRYSLTPTRDRASGSIEVYVNTGTASKGRVVASLIRDGAVSVTASRDAVLQAGLQTIHLPFDLPSPDLWSPDRPDVYEARVTLETAVGRHEFTAETGFRQLAIQGSDFLLNGERLVLRGVCRHDLWHNQGHTMRSEQIEQDLRMIKGMGANFVRLVHYPHDRRVVEWANRIGLFVAEESGLVWVDTRQLTPETISAGLGNLERTIRRDWNAPSVFSFFLANESAPDLNVLREFVRRMRPLTPGIFLSTARLDTPEKTLAASKRMFDEAGLDFYTYHPYSYSARVFEEVAREFPGKPLLFTEWGGSAVGQSAILLKGSVDAISRLVVERRVAGHAFWSWADLPEFSRGGDELADGILISGVVGEDRTPKPEVYRGLAGLFRRPITPNPELPGELSVISSPRPPSAGAEFVTLPLGEAIRAPAQGKAWKTLEEQMKQFWASHDFTRRHWDQTGQALWFWSEGRIMLGGVPFDPPAIKGRVRPLVLTTAATLIEIPIERDRIRKLHVLGNVTLPDGYPMRGRPGETLGRYIIEYGDGERKEHPLRLGHELARANMIAVATRVDPVATSTERVAVFTKDRIREAYQVLRLSLAVKPKRVHRLLCEFNPEAPAAEGPPSSTHHDVGPAPNAHSLLIFAVTAELGSASDKLTQ
ncbi:MAG: hypothetical protein LC130_22040 [Bryobacterales bacterium]|nr:hypothetical protein [Bryobacterales bacterium]